MKELEILYKISIACGFGAGLELTRGLPRPEPRRREPYRQQTRQPWRIFFPRVDGTGLLSAPPPASPISLARGAAPSRWGGRAACWPLPPRGGVGVALPRVECRKLARRNGEPPAGRAPRTGGNSALLRPGPAMRRCYPKAALQKLTVREFGFNSFWRTLPRADGRC